MKKVIFTLILFFIFLLSSQAQKFSNQKYIVLIGIDGVSAEGFQYANTPVINGLIKEGCISLKARGVMPTVSAPNWASILSGAGPEQHGVTSNNWTLTNQGFEPTARDADGYFPTIFTLINKQIPKSVTGMFYDWDWLGTFINKKYVTKQILSDKYQIVTSDAVDFIKKEKPVFTFIYYGHPDEVGHSKGHGTKEYFQSISEIDAEIGKVINALKETEIYTNSTIIITSDHGGIGFGHGGESMIELEVPWIISGKGIRKNTLLELPVDHLNTAPTIAKILGLKVPIEWIGRPVNEAFESSKAPTKPRQYVAKPWCSLAEGAYTGPQQIEMTSASTDASIFFTLDGTSPGPNSKKYTSPFTISKNATLKALAISGPNFSQVITKSFYFIDKVKAATLTNQPSEKYPGSGVLSLFDGLMGSSNIKGKQWMGFEGDDFEVTADLGEEKTIKMIGLDVLQLPAAWVFLPQSVAFYSSSDGKEFKLLNTYYPSETDDIRLDGPVMLAKNFNYLTTRYIRVKAKNLGICPEGHPGAGQKAWLFVSEVEIE